MRREDSSEIPATNVPAVHRSAAHASAWCILRTSGGKTLALAQSLIDANIDAWTPMQKTSRRRARSKVRVEVDAPMMPTFVFVRAAHLPELELCLALPMSPHPAFSIFRYFGRIPLLAASEIAGLRQAEWAGNTAPKKADPFPAGTDVTLTEGAAAGMSGIVEVAQGKYALVAFGGSIRWKIATFLLRTDAIEQPSSDPSDQRRVGQAAQAA
jgi:hypothetical protein